MAGNKPGRVGWREDGGPSVKEVALAIVVVLAVAIGAVVLLGDQTSQILMVQSHAI